VPELDASRLRAPGVSWLEPRQVRLEIADERFVSPDDKSRSIEDVRAAVSTTLARVGIAVTPNAVNQLSFRFAESDRPIGEFATNECVTIKATLRDTIGRQVEASGFGCANERNLYGYPLRGNTTKAFEAAINAAFGEMLRVSQQLALPPVEAKGGHRP
jgi:hypothetical protein